VSDLDAQLLAAHEVGDGPLLAKLYAEAAAASKNDLQSSFYLTHAYVFALEAGLPEAKDYHQQLKLMGKEE